MVSRTIDFKYYLNSENLALSVAPGDGHCLLHSFIKSYYAQHNICLELNTIKSLIFIETVTKVDYYAHFVLPGEKLLISLCNYIMDKY